HICCVRQLTCRRLLQGNHAMCRGPRLVPATSPQRQLTAGGNSKGKNHMSLTKKAVALAATGAFALSLAACGSAGTTAGGGDGAVECNVGISMPTRSLERWINDGEQLQKSLKDADCKVDLQYADNK